MLEWCSIAVISTSSPALNVRAAERLRDEVDALGRAAGEDDLARRGGVEERPHLLAGGLVGLGRKLAQHVDAAMDVGVAADVVVHQRVEHGLRLLRRGGVVEIDQRLAVHLLVQDREIRAEARDVEPGHGAGRCRCRRRSDPLGHFAVHLGEIARQLRVELGLERDSQRLDLHPFEDLTGEGVNQQVARLEDVRPRARR